MIQGKRNQFVLDECMNNMSSTFGRYKLEIWTTIQIKLAYLYRRWKRRQANVKLLTKKSSVLSKKSNRNVGKKTTVKPSPQQLDAGKSS